MTNKTFEPVGLLEITKQLADSAQAHVDRGRKQVADLEDRLHSALDAKRDVASDYATQLDFALKRNQGHWQNGYDAGYSEGYANGWKAGSLTSTEDRPYRLVCKNTISVNGVLYTNDPDNISNESLNRILGTSEQRDRELLESHGIDIEPLFANVQKIIADHETGSTTSHEQDIDEDEPDQYPPEPEKWGGTK